MKGEVESGRSQENGVMPPVMLKNPRRRKSLSTALLRTGKRKSGVFETSALSPRAHGTLDPDYQTLFPHTLLPKNSRAMINAMFVKCSILKPPFRFSSSFSFPDPTSDNLEWQVVCHNSVYFPVVPGNI
jgi:hypothetical protein